MSSDRIDALSRSLAAGTSRRSLLTLLGVGVAGTAVSVVGLNEALAKSSKNIGPLTNKLTNIPLRAKEGDRKFDGKLSVQSFEQEGQGIVAVAKVTGKVDKKHGNGTKNISRTVRVPVVLEASDFQSQVICEVLNLVLGPINLNLLGLRLRTNTIRIRLTADSQGGLLGSLLCGLAGPIGGGPLGQIVDLLNQILGELTGGLGA